VAFLDGHRPERKKARQCLKETMCSTRKARGLLCKQCRMHIDSASKGQHVMKLIWSPLSLQRIQEISDYIALDNISAANNWIDLLFDKVEKLKNNPEIGRVVPEIGKSDIRELIFGNYRIIYFASKKQISVLTVRHFKQILPTEEIGF